MSITICDTHLTRTVRYLSLTYEPVYLNAVFIIFKVMANMMTDEFEKETGMKG